MRPAVKVARNASASRHSRLETEPNIVVDVVDVINHDNCVESLEGWPEATPVCAE